MPLTACAAMVAIAAPATAPLEDNDAEQVKTDIQDGRDGEEQERRAAVTDGAQDAGEQIV